MFKVDDKMNRDIRLNAFFSIAFLLLFAVLFSLFVSADGPTCEENNYNECFDCYVSRHVILNADCSYTIDVPSQYDGACGGWCTTPPPPDSCAVEEHNECTGCQKSKRVKTNSDCSTSTVVEEQFDAGCDQGTLCAGQTCDGKAVPRQYNECFDCYVSRRVRQNADCSTEVIIGSQYDGGCGGWCITPPPPETCAPTEYTECTGNCNEARLVRQKSDCSYETTIYTDNSCTAGCPTPVQSVCGNSVVESGEECDPAGSSESKSCGLGGTQSRTCRYDCSWGDFSGCEGEGVCLPGQTDSQSCGSSNVGQCRFGTKTRTCQSNFQWGDFGGCSGEVGPSTEVCDGVDNNCNNQIDEGRVCNRAPVLDPIGNKQVDEGVLLQFVVSGSDPDGDVLSFSASNLPSGASFDASSRAFSWTPGVDQAGSQQVSFSVSDGVLSDSETITITVGNVNRAPVLDPIGNKQVDEGVLLQFVVSGSDPDGDALAFSAFSAPMFPLPSGASFDASSRTFSWTPGLDQAGSYQITFFVSDATLSDLETITITVGNVNQPPRITTSPPTVIVEPDAVSFSAVYTYDADAVDPDNDNITFLLSQAPEGASIDPSTGVVSWKPSKSQLGLNAFTLVASDGSLTSTQSWNVDVRLPEMINIPRQELFVEHVIASECIEPGETDIIFISIENIGLHPLKNFVVTALAFDPDMIKRIGPFELDVGDQKSSAFYVSVPINTKPGKYDIRFTFSNDDLRRVKHREIEVKDQCVERSLIAD